LFRFCYLSLDLGLFYRFYRLGMFLGGWFTNSLNIFWLFSRFYRSVAFVSFESLKTKTLIGFSFYKLFLSWWFFWKVVLFSLYLHLIIIITHFCFKSSNKIEGIKVYKLVVVKLQNKTVLDYQHWICMFLYALDTNTLRTQAFDSLFCSYLISRFKKTHQNVICS